MLRALPAPDHASSGGQGEDTPLSRSDLRDIEQAVRGRWPIRDEDRTAIVDVLTVIARNPGQFGIREARAAARTLLQADRLNMEEERRTPKGPAEITKADGTAGWDFSRMSTEELSRWLEEQR